MPTYVYECKKCQKTIEVEQRISEDPLKDCECGGKGTLKRVIQPTAVLFKGSGFHINDYSDKSGSDAKSEKSEKAEPSDKPEKKAKAEKADKPETSAKPAKPETKKADLA